MSRIALLSAPLVLILAVAATACDRCGKDRDGVYCPVCGCLCCPCQIGEHTIMVPMCVTQTRMTTKVVETQKEREETYTVFKCVPEKRKYTKECCYLEREVKSKEITKSECHRVQDPVTLEDTVKVPFTQMEEGERCREVCTECGKVCVKEPCLKCVTRTEDEPRTQNCSREQVVFEDCKKTIDYCVLTPKTETKECAVETVYKLVPIEKTRKVQVCVPELVKVPVDVKVMQMVAKNICCCDDCWCDIQKQASCGKDCKDCKDHLSLFKKDKK